MRRFRDVSVVPLLCLALTACDAGEAGAPPAEDTLGELPAAVEGTQLFAMHDPGGAFLMTNAGRKGWVVYTEQVQDTRPRSYSTAQGALVRLNWGYDPNGTLPCEDQYDTFATMAANVVRSSTGANIWIIGNEGNLRVEWPTCAGVKQPITPERYARAFRKARAAIRAVPGHENDRVVMQGVGVWAVTAEMNNMNWVQYYEAVLNSLGAGEVDGIAVHTYARDTDPNNVRKDFIHLDDHRQWGFRAYRDFLNATPHWARSLPVYITETDQNVAWADTNSGWVRNAYAEIHDWNFGAGSETRQKVQALALYRWDGPPGDPYSIHNRGGVQQDFRDAMANSYPAPAAGMPVESKVNECSNETTQYAAWTASQTGFRVSGYINQFWNQNGGIGIFGLPWSNARRLVNSSGNYVCSQIFERHRIEIQLNDNNTVKLQSNGQPFITLGLVGNERKLRDLDMIHANLMGYGASGGNAADCQSFVEVPYRICGLFKAYWNQGGLNGGSNHLGLFGFPTSEPFRYMNKNGEVFVSQYFERARFEIHGSTVMGGLLGAELKFGERR